MECGGTSMKHGDADGTETRITARQDGVIKVKQRRISKDEFLALLQGWISKPQPLNSVEVNAMQLHQTFVDLYMPRVVSHLALNSIFRAAPSSPALFSAIKSVSLLLLHRESDDLRLFHAAGPEYSKALRGARKELCQWHGGKAMVVGIAHMLSLCELFNNLSLKETAAGSHHARWITMFMETCRAEMHKSEVRSLMESGVRWFATWGVLLARKGVPGFTLATHCDNEEPKSSLTIEIGDLIIATSGVIELGDNLCAEVNPSNQRVFQVLNEIIWLEGELHEWMKRYYVAAVAPKSLFWAVPHEKEDRRTLTVFPYLYSFPNLHTAGSHVSYWMCLLVLVEARFAILKAFCHKIQDAQSAEFLRLKRASDGYADSIGMSIPFLGRSDNGWAGRIVAIHPLNLLLGHYKQRCEWQKLSWCVRCAANLRIRGRQSPSTQVDEIG